MQASEAARIFHDWAFEEGLISDAVGVSSATTEAEMALITPVTDAGKQILRTKRVQSVSFSSERGEVVVFTKRATPTSKKQLAALPAQIDDVVIKYRQGVPGSIGQEPSQPFGGPAYTVRTVGQSQLYTCGSSVSVGNCRDAGTLSCLVRDAAGTLYGLSNNHVTGSCSFAGIGLPILAPGVFDVVPQGLPPFTIGFHSTALPLIAGSADNVNVQSNLDAAIFRIADEDLVSSFQGTSYDTPTRAVQLLDNMNVEKVGRTTQHTTGRVVSQIYGAHPIQYNAAMYGFNGLVSFDPVDVSP